jgi:peptide deformylase
VIRAQDLDGKHWELVAEELLARCFCHEMDHLDGVLFIDKLSPLKRNLVKRKLRKARIPA